MNKKETYKVFKVVQKDIALINFTEREVYFDVEKVTVADVFEMLDDLKLYQPNLFEKLIITPWLFAIISAAGERPREGDLVLYYDFMGSEPPTYLPYKQTMVINGND